MPHKLKKWLKSLGKKKSDGREMPSVPARWAGILTPRSSQEALVASASVATARSLFFQRLPPELRRQILMEAFGDRIIHMDLSFDHPRVPPPPGSCDPKNLRHCAIYCGEDYSPPPLKLDCSKPKAWRWFGCVCHRDSEYIVRGKVPRLRDPWMDQCLTGAWVNCKSWRGDMPFSCFLGVMGWLRTCRQAYIEGIEVLYATNTIQMSSIPMIRRLPDLLPAQRLAAISSVEMVWKLDATMARPGQSGPPESGKAVVAELFQAIPRMLPGLRKLHISIDFRDWYPRHAGFTSPEDRLARGQADFVALADEMVGQFGPGLQEFNLGLPNSIHEPYLRAHAVPRLRAHDIPGTPYEIYSEHWVGYRIWRPLQALGEGRGYWIRETRDDLYNLAVQPCFGCGWY